MIRLVKRQRPAALWLVLSPLLALLLTLLAGSALFAALDAPVAGTLYLFVVQPLTDAYGLSELLLKATPLALCALGLSFCYRARIWNIGAEGQFVMGALGGGAVALGLDHLPGAALLPLCLATGILAGALWAALAAWLKTRFGANEILTTIMLNYVAAHLLAYAVHGPLRDPMGFSFPESALFADAALLPVLADGYRLTVAAAAALLLGLALWGLQRHSAWAFQLRVLGADAEAAAFAGFPPARLAWSVLLVSGALSGLAGIGEVAGPVGQLTPHVSFGYGYAAIIVAFLGRLHALGVLFASLVLALTYLGGENLQVMANLPKSLAALFQGMLLFFLLACDLAVSHRLVRVGAPRAEPAR